MNAKYWTKKIAGACVAGVLLTGTGMTAALAATPTTPAPAGAYTMSKVTNLTPFTWKFQAVPGFDGYDVAPPQTLLPGQTASWAAHDVQGRWKSFKYVFTDGQGNGHTVQLLDASHTGNGEGQYLQSYSMDGTGADAVQSTASFHMVQDADGFKRHVDALWTQPSTTTIDAASDSTEAAAIVNAELPRASTVSWSPESETPKYSKVDAQQASSMLQNNSSADASIEFGQDTKVGESTKIGEETTALASTNVFGVAAKVAASVTGEREWTNSNTVTLSGSALAHPGYTGYLIKATSVATLTGTLKFTTPEGAKFAIINVAISRGGIANPDGSMPGGMNVSATEVRTTYPGSGPVVAALAGGGVGISDAAPAGAPGAAGQVVIIDAAADPDAAKDALTLYHGASNTAFTPTAAPVYSVTDWAPVLDKTGNQAMAVSGNARTGQQLTQTLEVTHDQDASWSLGGSIEASVGFDLLAAVDADLSTKFTAGHTWEGTESDNESIEVTALGGKTVWIEANNSTATITGDFTFDVNGIHYDVENVSITQPASEARGTEAATSYRVMELSSRGAGLPADTAGGIKPINALPKLKSHIVKGH